MGKRFLKPIIMLLFVAVAGVAIMLLWNAIVPSVIGWGSVSYLQAVGLFLLSRILFGSISGLKWHANTLVCSNRDELSAQLRGMSREEKREYIRRQMGNEQ